MKSPTKVIAIAAAFATVASLAACSTGASSDGKVELRVATFPPGAPLPVGWRRIGTVHAGEGITVDGEPYDGAMGWDHFA